MVASELEIQITRNGQQNKGVRIAIKEANGNKRQDRKWKADKDKRSSTFSLLTLQEVSYHIVFSSMVIRGLCLKAMIVHSLLAISKGAFDSSCQQ